MKSKTLIDIFNITDKDQAALLKRYGKDGNEYKIDCFDRVDIAEDVRQFIPEQEFIKYFEKDKTGDLVQKTSDKLAYVFTGELLKILFVGYKKNVPTYLYGHAGVGKTTAIEQFCAVIGLPFLRVQHTANTEESHILGQWGIKNGETKFELGPLPYAMKNGLIYCADEYDFALPCICSVYQPVLEGKPLVIKDADPENRVIKPHPNFRFMATGNTNGAGDESGLYQGTNIQNAANYDRFGLVYKVNHLAEDAEFSLIKNKLPTIEDSFIKSMLGFATQIRKQFDEGKLCNTLSPRALLNIIMIGNSICDFHKAVELSFANRLNDMDRQAVIEIADRVIPHLNI
jgi:cobaltochelatase CobS